MKTFKFILTLLFVMLASSTFAQQLIVQKTDGTKVQYTSNDVDSIAFVPQSDKPIAYYGWGSYEDVYTIPTFTDQHFPIEIKNVLHNIEGEELKTGQCLVVAAKGNIMGVEEQSGFLGMYGFTSGEAWEVNNTVEINGKTYFVWIRSAGVSRLTTKIMLMLDE